MSLENIELKEEICRNYQELKYKYEKLTESMEDYLGELLFDNRIRVKSINARTKSLESLRRKIEMKNYKYSSLGDITDLTGLRIITYYADDVYKIENIIREKFYIDSENSINKARILDYDRFGYLSLHYVVELKPELLKTRELEDLEGLKFEIQIRSILQDAWAEIEHDLGYKNKNGIPRKVKRDFSRLAGLLELADKEFLSIRNYINNYENEILDEIKILKKPVLVDDITVRAYIKYNEFYRGILNKLGEEVPIRKMNEVNNIAKQLLSINIDTLNQVEELIRNNSKFILNMMKYEKIRIYNFIGEADIMLYVCYAKLLNQVRPEEELIRFWDDNGYTNSDISHEHKLEWVENLKKYLK